MSSIEITINNLTTFKTSPLPVFQGKGIVNPSTVETPFAGREKSVNLPKMDSIPFGFVFKLANKFKPSTVADAFSKTVVRHDALHVQVFGKDSLVFANQPMTQFVKKIFSLIRNVVVDTCNLYSGFISSIASLCFAGKAFLCQFKFLFRFAKIFRRIDYFASRSYGKRFKSQINTYFTAILTRLDFFFYLTKNRSEIFAGRCLGNGDAFHLSFNSPMENDFYGSNLGDTKMFCVNIYAKMLRHRKRLFSILFLKVWKLETMIKEVIVGIIQMSQSLLKGLRIRFFKPYSIGLALEFRQHLCRIVIIKGLLIASLVRGIKIYSLPEEIVIDKTGLPEKRCKNLLLFGSWIQSKLEGFVNSFKHVYNYTPCGVNCQGIYFKRKGTPYIPTAEAGGITALF